MGASNSSRDDPYASYLNPAFREVDRVDAGLEVGLEPSLIAVPDLRLGDSLYFDLVALGVQEQFDEVARLVRC